ncbi:glycerate kinase [Ramlibacter sp.]|uniref:glycerate kinase n=1 Tax=Ramlibacter sp. TaxID=1917967 RepID=UPI002B693B19|nr:glycerate kinase [Ramlibacter sp.]HWI82180.1 glycerate kinase [Ramlibacter sp.]
MNLQKILAPILGVVLVAAAWRAYGWAGVALVLSGIVMWMLLHFTRLTRVLGKTADRPMGYVGSAVMLNAKLKPGVNLLHVIAMTEAMGERLSAEHEEPEIYRWTDGTASSVTCEFVKGRLAKWTLSRPEQPEAAPPA